MLIKTLLTSGMGMATPKKPENRRGSIRIQLPCFCIIGLEKFKIENLSISGFSIRSATNFINRPVATRILFPFKETAFQTALSAQQVYYDLQKKNAGFRFTDVEESGISLVRGMIANHMAGTAQSETQRRI